jgi:nucleotide-binding universal stress UspA family protein
MFLMILVAWLAIGAISVAVMHRRGHDTFAWAVPFLFLGPLALPVAISSDRHRPVEPARPLPLGGLDVLAFCDGSEDAAAALDAALTVLGDRATSLTLAAVVDFEAATTVRGRETQREAQDRLDDAARQLEARTTSPVATVVLFGEPKHALQHYASTNGYELIVTGSHTFGRSWLGSAAVTRVAGTDHSVPVLIGPERP